MVFICIVVFLEVLLILEKLIFKKMVFGDVKKVKLLKWFMNWDLEFLIVLFEEIELSNVKKFRN